jgi:hypothetical protein
MKNIGFIGLFFIAACSIQVKPIKAPKDLIPLDSFKMVFTEMTILETYIEKKYTSQLMEYQEIMKVSGDSLLAKYGINSKRYKRSMVYYIQNNTLIDSLYTEVMDTLTIRKENSR